jgi:predicted dehydrogenase
MNNFTRRQFLRSASIAGAAVALGPSILKADTSAEKKLVLAVMGTNGRGGHHIKALLAIPNVEIAYVCDPDKRAIAKGVKQIAEKQQRQPQGVEDFRRALDDPSVDAICIAAPNHWHAPATILACAAGKHVYVEKPGSHTAEEAGLMVKAARKHNRVVQMGNQRRSVPIVIEAIERVKSGAIGEVGFARAWYTNARKSIGRGETVPVPAELDYSIWQGPAPERPYVSNLVHYNWHWRWHWGGGELANNGIHSLDLVRWGLSVDLPTTVTCGGGKYAMPASDDQETPDTIAATYNFGGGKGCVWEGHSAYPRGFEGAGFGVSFYGSGGNLVIDRASYRILDPKGEVVQEQKAEFSDVPHFENFVEAIRNGTAQTAEIEDAQRSTMLCHLGNIAYRTGSTVHFDPASGQIVNNRPAMELWSREYRNGWEPKV